MTAEVLLSRLEKVKATGSDRWIARCPAHGDKSPSLTVRELPDGRVLVHCFTGCATDDVLAAVGLEFSDLFPEPLPEANPDQAARHRQRRQGFAALDVLQALSMETTVVAIAAGQIHRRGWLNDCEDERLALAHQRIIGGLAYAERAYG